MILFTNLKNDKTGFTLVELVVVMAIFSIVTGVIYSVFASVNRTSTKNEVTAEVMQNARTSIEFMEQDIRLAGLDRFKTADAGIEGTPTDTHLQFTADRNMDGAINTANVIDGIQEQDLEQITYTYEAGGRRLRQCLSEGTTNAWDTVAENVTDFQFTYLDAADNILPAPVDASLVRTVQISLTIEKPAGIFGTVTRTLSTRILCRNLGF